MQRIGIDLGGTKTEGIVVTPDGAVVTTLRRSTPVQDGYDAIIAGIEALVHDLEARAGESCSVGVCTPGARSARTGRMKNSNTVCLNDRDLRRDLERLLERPVRIENDANCFALSEATDGAARDYGVVFGVIMGTGVGGGLVIDKRLHAGPQHIAGEWGHNILETDGPPCYCGKRGCVETFLSGPGLLNDWHGVGPGPTSVQELLYRADGGEPASIAALDRFHNRFGAALAAVINILDPDAVVLGGGLSNIGSLYERGVAALAGRVFNDEVTTPVVRNLHGDSSGVRGAAQLWAPHA